MKPDLFIFGGKSTALEIAEAAILQCNVGGVFFVVPDNEPNDGVSRISIDVFKADTSKVGQHFILSMADQSIRRNCLEVAQRHSMLPFSVIHPLAWVSPSASVGKGTYIAAHSIVSAQATVKNHVMINFQVLIGHDAVVDDHVTVNPGAKISGLCHVGEHSLIGANAVIFQGKEIGRNCAIDAMTYVNRNIEDGTLCTARAFTALKRPFIN